jgi:hypothetical protein
MRIPAIHIQQQYAQLAFDVDLGQLDMRQPPAELEIETRPARLEIESPPGRLTIDQTEALHAYGMGGTMKTMNFIYSQMRDIALQGIARIVEQGNRLAAFHQEPDAIANIAREAMSRENPLQYVGGASIDNVEVRYTANKPQINVIEGGVEIRVQPNRPIVNYIRGNSEFYMKQYAQVIITPPELDITL